MNGWMDECRDGMTSIKKGMCLKKSSKKLMSDKWMGDQMIELSNR